MTRRQADKPAPAEPSSQPAKIDLLAKWRAMSAMTADRRLSAGALAVAFQLLEHTDPRTGCAWPGIARLTDRTGLSERATQRAIDMLEETGWFHVPNRKGGRSVSTRYLFARWETPAPTTGFSNETPSRAAQNPGANRRQTPAPTPPDSPKESIYESRQRNLRVFGIVEAKVSATVPAFKTDPAMRRISAALANLPELENFHRRVHRSTAMLQRAYERERDEGEGAGIALLLDAIAEASQGDSDRARTAAR